MCTRPILIKNRKYCDLGVKLSSSYISVPCGECDECLSDKANDIYVRARYEFDDCLRSNGCGFMCCLTYSNETLPYFNVGNNKFMVFNKKHVIDFIKRLRISLERHYKKYFNRSAPAFKYLVTSEYGTDPTRTHRPHYHLLFFFHEQVGISTFNGLFARCLYVQVGKEKHYVFGTRYQCDILDPKRGGIKYSGKYVLKDLMYEPQRNSIVKLIKFYRDYVESKHGIISCPQTEDDFFYNRCVRSSKAYKRDISDLVLPYRHMLQFYMVSNDLGVSVIINKYGESIASLPCLNFEGFAYKIPRLVRQRIQKVYGSAKLDTLSKNIFISFLKSCTSDLVLCNKLLDVERLDILDFVERFIYLRSGQAYLVNPEGFDLVGYFDDMSKLDFDSVSSDFALFVDNDFFEKRRRLYQILSMYNSNEMLEFRSRIAKQKKDKQREMYESKKRNNPIHLY